MGLIQELAVELGSDERTLRRSVALGSIRCRRPGPRRLHLAAGEREYLRRHWGLIGELRGALRTDRSVRLAVLYGSFARGDEDDDSDLDLLVSLVDGRPGASVELALDLERASGRSIDIAHLSQIERTAPLLLDRVFDEGRVLVDRDGLWQPLRARRRSIRARARRAHLRQLGEAADAIEELVA